MSQLILLVWPDKLQKLLNSPEDKLQGGGVREEEGGGKRGEMRERLGERIKKLRGREIRERGEFLWGREKRGKFRRSR